MGVLINEQWYNTILCQELSPDKRFLVLGDINGYLSIFDLRKILVPDLGDGEEGKVNKKPKCRVQLTQQRINSFAKSNDMLIVGQTGVICGYDWPTVTTSSRTPRVYWSVKIPDNSNVDINCLAFDGQYLFAGCDNGDFVKIDVEYNKILDTIPTQHVSIYDVVIISDKLVTCGEDGNVLIWDKRIKNVTKTLNPIKINQKLDRNKFGPWISSVDLNDDDWLICGGGATLSLWHLGMLESAMQFDTFQGSIFQAKFCNDGILAAGAYPFVHHYSLDGSLQSEIPCSPTTVYSILYEFETTNVLSIAGSSSKFDFCTTLNYRDLILSLI